MIARLIFAVRRRRIQREWLACMADHPATRHPAQSAR